MTFVANPAAPAAPAIADKVDGDGWYPDLSIANFRGSIRLGTTVTDLRARDAMIAGFISTAVELAAWREAQEAAGVTGLALANDAKGRPFVKIAGEPASELIWRRAVYAYAAADLAETHGDISATEAGRDRREVRASSADEHRRNATIAIRDLQGRGRAKVRLI